MCKYKRVRWLVVMVYLGQKVIFKSRFAWPCRGGMYYSLILSYYTANKDERFFIHMQSKFHKKPVRIVIRFNLFMCSLYFCNDEISQCNSGQWMIGQLLGSRRSRVVCKTQQFFVKRSLFIKNLSYLLPCSAITWNFSCECAREKIR